MSKPKTRHNKRRTGNRRAHHALKALQTTKCSACGADVLPHHACPACGAYNGRKAMSIDAAVEKELKKEEKTSS